MSCHRRSQRQSEKASTVVGVGDDELPGPIDTLAAAQGPGEEAAEDIDKHIFYPTWHMSHRRV
jgi:hypothetical protein